MYCQVSPYSLGNQPGQAHGVSLDREVQVQNGDTQQAVPHWAPDQVNGQVTLLRLLAHGLKGNQGAVAQGDGNRGG